MRQRRARRTLLAGAAPMTQWAAPVITELAEAVRRDYERNHAALTLWAQDLPETDIRKRSGRTARQARALALRAVEINPFNGKEFGFWVCVPGWRPAVGSYTRREPLKPDTPSGRGLAGALQLTFEKYPSLLAAVRAAGFGRRVAGNEKAPLVPPRVLHAVFLREARRLGLQERNEWPFSTQRKGREALRKWWKQESQRDPIAAVDSLAGQDAAYRTKVDYGQTEAAGPRRRRLAFERVELDEKTSDMMFAIGFPSRGGGVNFVRSMRPTALVMVETVTTSTLASLMTFGGFGSNEVKQLIARALHPPPRFRLPADADGFAYRPGAAYPAEQPEFLGNGWQELAMDSLAAHLSGSTLGALGQALNCRVDKGPVGNPVARHCIESAFRRLAALQSVFPSATGNTPGSPVRRNPEKAAIDSALMSNLAEMVLDLECRNHNARPSDACDGQSPLQMLHGLLMTGRVFKSPLLELRPDTLWRFLPAHPVTINRAREGNRLGPPYVQLAGARYRSPELQAWPQFSTLKSWSGVLYVEEDARFGHLVLDEHPHIRFRMAVNGKQAEMPHTLQWRQATNQYQDIARAGDKASYGDLALGVMEGLSVLGSRDERAAALLAETTRFMDNYQSGRYRPLGASKSDLDALLEAVKSLSTVEDEDVQAASAGPADLRPARESEPLSADDDDDDAGIVL